MYNLKLQENIEDLIYNIRGKEVMLDSDLARLYHCKNGTKDINKAVKRNINKFPNDFYFQLTIEEYDFLKFQIGTSKTRGGVRKLPFVFTEQGVAMLSSVLHTEVADETSINIMRAFVAMRHYIGDNEYRLSNVETKVIEHDNDIKLLQDAFDKFEEKKVVNEIYFNGQMYDAYSRILNIFKEAKESLIIIDSYSDNILLDIIRKLDINAILITTNKYINNNLINKYNEEYNNLKVIFDNTFHDRFFILDKKTVYHCGSSINRIGFKTFAINLISDNDSKKSLLLKINQLIKNIDFKIK